MPMAPGYKQRWINTKFNAGNDLSSIDWHIGISHGNPYLIENELSNPANDLRIPRFKTWPRWNGSLGTVGRQPAVLDYNTATNTREFGVHQTSDWGWTPPFNQETYSITVYSGDPYYRAPDWYILTNGGTFAATQSEFNNQLMAVIPMNNDAAWDNPAIFLRQTTDVLAARLGDISITWGAA